MTLEESAVFLRMERVDSETNGLGELPPAERSSTSDAPVLSFRSLPSCGFSDAREMREVSLQFSGRNLPDRLGVPYGQAGIFLERGLFGICVY